MKRRRGSARVLPVAPRARLWRRGLGMIAAAGFVSLALVAQASIASNASWTDSEWDHAAVGASDCSAPEGDFATRAEGKLLSGSALAIDTGEVANVEGVTVTNDGARAAATSGNPVNGIDDAYADPLEVDLLNAIPLSLTGALELPTGNAVGVAGQFGQARSGGLSYAASGAVDSSGGIDLQPTQTGDYPTLATLQLSDLLDSELLGDLQLGGIVGDVTELSVDVGAVASRASYDACAALWNETSTLSAKSLAFGSQEAVSAVADDAVAGLERESLAASANLRFTSAAVGNITSAIVGTSDEACGVPGASLVTAVRCLVEDSEENPAVLSGVTSGVTKLLGTLTNGLGLGTIAVDLDLQPDVSALQDIANGTFADRSRVVSIDLGDGSISVDTAGLLHAAYPEKYSDRLNALPPNTNPLADPAVLETLLLSVQNVLTTLVADLSAALVDAVMSTQVKAALTVDLTLRVLGLLPVDIGEIDVSVGCPADAAPLPACTLAQLGDPGHNTHTAEASLALLPDLAKLPVVGSVIDGLINGVVGGILAGLVTTLSGGVGAIVGGVLNTALSLLKQLPSALSSVTSPVFSAVIGVVSRLYTGLVLDEVLSITFNAQNRTPDPGDDEPVDWEDLPAGQYDVAAVRIGILDGLEERGLHGVQLYLGRASVGPGCSAAMAAVNCSGY